MTLTMNDPLSIQQFVDEKLAAPGYFPPFTVTSKPTNLKFRHRGIYITNTSKPAWMDSAGTWRYADGSTV